MLTTVLSLSLSALSSQAQSHLVKLTNHLEPYGFFRASAIFDARDSKADAEDLFYYLPYDKDINLEGKDTRYNPSLKMSAVTTRVGFNLTGFQYGSFNVTGRLEADFYLMNGTSASLRLREAYLNLGWSGLGDVFCTASFKVGQAWHPMSVGMPCSVGYEVGSPFNPYARSPQLMFETSFLKRLTFTAGALYPMEFTPTGPQGPSLIPWSLTLFLQNDLRRGIGLLILYGAAALSRQALEPRLVGKQVGLHPLLTLLALYTGFRAAGVAGMILFPIGVIFLKQLWDHAGLSENL